MVVSPNAGAIVIEMCAIDQAPAGPTPQTHVQGLLTVGGGEHVKTFVLERPLNRLPDARVVVDGRFRGRWRWWGGGLAVAERQPHDEGAPGTNRAGGGQGSTMLLNDLATVRTMNGVA